MPVKKKITKKGGAPKVKKFKPKAKNGPKDKGETRTKKDSKKTGSTPKPLPKLMVKNSEKKLPENQGESVNAKPETSKKGSVVTGLSLAANAVAGVTLVSLGKKYLDTQKELKNCKLERRYYQDELDQVENKPGLIESLRKAKKDLLSSTGEHASLESLSRHNKELQEKLNLATENYNKLRTHFEQKGDTFNKVVAELEACKKGNFEWQQNAKGMQDYIKTLQEENKKSSAELKKHIAHLENQLSLQAGGRYKKWF